MKPSGLSLAIAFMVLAVSNALVLVHVAANRGGTTDAQVELTSRELILSRPDSEDSSVSLMIRWQNPAPEYGGASLTSSAWFDERKLRDVGFDLSVPASSPAASRYYRNQRQRRVYVALEFDGPSSAQWFAARPRPDEVYPAWQNLTLDQQREIERSTESRLVAVDAGADPAALRRAHPDSRQALILPALARVMLDEARPAMATRAASPARLRGAISRLSISQITVPRPLSESLGGLPQAPAWSFEFGALKVQPITYTVTLAVGSKYEPWIVNVKRRR
jgi:hypothetical protein